MIESTVADASLLSPCPRVGQPSLPAPSSSSRLCFLSIRVARCSLWNHGNGERVMEVVGVVGATGTKCC